MKPAWWEEAEPDIDQSLEGFTAKLKKKLQVKPITIIRRKILSCFVFVLLMMYTN